MRKDNSLSQMQMEVRHEVERAFKRECPPESEKIIDTGYIEPLQVREFFSGRPWWEITLEVLRSEYSGDASACLSFMSAEGRNYYIPAYLLMAVEKYYEGGVVSADFSARLLMYARDDEFYRVSELGVEKMHAVAEVLRFLVDFYDDEDAQDALDVLWGDF
ncbi:DUF6714 family protein [Pseudomonas sp. UFMG81]|uniref:DUF6714 family protein n=1 Tax=Pseudomonas sp. UFMG81 TaxID=2745936 RepID=UPI00188F317C|nr:DUF6714 family protein [Pseudomonas sp. UFMG81]